MQKWEYLFLVISELKDEYKVKTINGKEIANWETGPLFPEYANKLGEDGWELVAAPYTTMSGSSVSSSKTSPRLIFKRPK